jgi:hypothetical protein
VERGSYLPHFLVFTLLHITVSRGFRLEGNFLTPPPPCLHSSPSGTPKPPPLLPCLPPFIISTVGLLPHNILKQGDPPQGTARIIKILHKNAYALKRQKLTQSDENELEQTHLGVDDPLP